MKHFCSKNKKKYKLDELIQVCSGCEPIPQYCHVASTYEIRGIQLFQKSIKQRLKDIEESEKAEMSKMWI
jgi:hypothetical protein